MTDQSITEKLRDVLCSEVIGTDSAQVMRKAASELDWLAAENARYREWLLALHADRHGDTEATRNQAALAVAQWIESGRAAKEERKP